MRKKMLLLAAVAALGLAGCGGNTTDSSTPDASDSASDSGGSTSSGTTVRRFLRETVPFVEVSTEIDLDDYVTVEYRDGSTDKNYTITVTDPNVTLNGHVLYSDTIGEYRVDIAAGSLTGRISLRFVSEEMIKVTDFLAPLASDSGNYTADTYYGGSNYPYYWSHYRAGNYSVRFDPDDLDKTETSTDSDTGRTIVTPVNNVLALLSDNNYYQGSVVEGETAGTFDVEFKPGKITNAPYYYTMLGITYDSGNFEDTVIGSTSYVMGGPTFAETLVTGGFGYGFYIGEEYDAQYYGAIAIGTTDTDKDGKLDSVSFEVLYTYEEEIYGLMIVTLRDVGSTDLEWMKTPLETASYVPVPYPATEIPNAFTALAEGGNYTATMTFEQLDSDLTDVADINNGYDAMNMLHSANKVVIKNTYTKEGVISTYSEEDIVWNEGGTAFTIADMAQSSGWAAWTDGTKSWQSIYDGDEKAYGARTELLDADGKSTADVYDAYIDDKGFSADGITAANVAATNWTNQEISADTVTYSGDAGDNDGSNVTNGFLREVLTLFGDYTCRDLSTDQAEIIANFWCDRSAQPFTDGNYHASSLYSSWDEVAVNTVTHEMTMQLTMYAPFGLDDYDGNGYYRITIAITDVGTTTNDFSGFPAEATPAA